MRRSMHEVMLERARDVQDHRGLEHEAAGEVPDG
jgi:hypothetical protein